MPEFTTQDPDEFEENWKSYINTIRRLKLVVPEWEDEERIDEIVEELHEIVGESVEIMRTIKEDEPSRDE